MLCWQPFGRPVVPLVYIRNSGASAGMEHRLDGLPGVAGEQLVDEEVAAVDHRGLRRVLAGVAPPDEHLVDLLAFLGRHVERLVGLDLVVDQLAGRGSSRPW